MIIIEKELDRVLTLLRNKIRERGFTQLEVQDALNWGRSYISQLLTKQKSLRVEQVLLILDVIGVDPSEFFGELYQYPHSGGLPRVGGYMDAPRGRASYGASYVADGGLPGEESGEELSRSLDELRSLLRSLMSLLVDKKIISVDELASTVDPSKSSSVLEDL